MIAIIATGGTITNTPAGRLPADEAIAQVPELNDVAKVSLTEVNRVASSALGITHMIDVADHVNRALADDQVEGVVVTTGSNQSEDLAYFLNLTIATDRPIVVTAAQRQRTTMSEDATRNLIDAVVTAKSPESAGKGVLLVANELIHPAREVTKSVVSRVDSWLSPDTGALGIVSDGRPVFYRTPLRRHTSGSEFSTNESLSTLQLPKVEIVYSYVDADPAIVELMVDRLDVRGVVVAAFATGAPFSEQAVALEKVANNGTPVVISNRGNSGRIPDQPHPLVGADNLTPQKALVLLRLALSRGADAEQLRRIFAEY